MEHPFQTWDITTADAARRGDKSWEQWPEAGYPEAEGLGQGRGRTGNPAVQPPPEPDKPLREEG